MYRFKLKKNKSKVKKKRKKRICKYKKSNGEKVILFTRPSPFPIPSSMTSKLSKYQKGSLKVFVSSNPSTVIKKNPLHGRSRRRTGF